MPATDLRPKWSMLQRAAPALIALCAVASCSPADAATTRTVGAPNTFVLTGAVRGTLVVKTNIDCSDMTANHESLGWLGARLRPYPSAAWGIVFQFPRYGTWRKFSFAGALVTFSAAGYGTWLSTSGTFTTKANAGTVNVMLGGHELGAKGTIHLIGKWNCG